MTQPDQILELNLSPLKTVHNALRVPKSNLELQLTTLLHNGQNLDIKSKSL